MRFKRIKKCQYCKKEFEPWPPTAKVCSIDCAANIARKKREKLERAEIRTKREALKTRSDYLKEAQREFNSYIRERDRGKGCICCKVPLGFESIGGAYDAGHYRSVGSAPHLRFNENNCHGQTKKCNRWGAGRAVDYRIGLISRIGEVAVQELENDNSTAKWTIEDLKSIKAHYKAKKNELRERRAYEMNDLHLAEVANEQS